MTKKTTSAPATPPNAPTAFATPDLATTGQGIILLALPTGQSRIKVATFFMDTHCLGVRKTTLTELGEHAQLAPILSTLNAAPIPLPDAKAIVEGALSFAKKLGLPPPARLSTTLPLFGPIPATTPSPIAFGKNGKPFYTQQEGDTPDFVETVLARLEKFCGPDGFGFQLDEELEDWIDGEDHDEDAAEDWIDDADYDGDADEDDGADTAEE
ncbi:MAG: hypothetical protein LBD14_03680 [Puniceicoccales bacterium]|jgi:hypothetical protein|nr:hypothetical protein [Puniceicoccales bacterium]